MYTCDGLWNQLEHKLYLNKYVKNEKKIKTLFLGPIPRDPKVVGL